MQRNITYSSTDEDIDAVASIAKENLQSKAFVHSSLLSLGIKNYKSLKAKNSRFNFIDDDESSRHFKKILLEKSEKGFDRCTIIRILDEIDNTPNEKADLLLLTKVLEHALSEIEKEYNNMSFINLSELLHNLIAHLKGPEKVCLIKDKWKWVS